MSETQTADPNMPAEGEPPVVHDLGYPIPPAAVWVNQDGSPLGGGEPPVVASDTSGVTDSSPEPTPLEDAQPTGPTGGSYTEFSSITTGTDNVRLEPNPTEEIAPDDTARPWHGSSDPWEAMYQFVKTELDALKQRLTGA